MITLTPAEVLALWEAQHGPLEPSLQRAFLARPEVAELADMDARTVIWAIREYRKLAEIVIAARRWEPPAGGEEADPPEGGSGGTPPSGPKPGRSPNRSTATRSGTVTRYGSGTIRSEFNPEEKAPSGDICPSCGMQVGADGHCGCS